MRPGALALGLLFAGSIVSLSLGNVLLKLGMDRVATLAPAGAWQTCRAALATWQVPCGVVLLAAQFAGMLTLFKWGLDVTVVVPVFGLNYVVTALLGQVWLGESVDGLRWAGICAVTLGAALIGRSGAGGS